MQVDPDDLFREFFGGAGRGGFQVGPAPSKALPAAGEEWTCSLCFPLPSRGRGVFVPPCARMLPASAALQPVPDPSSATMPSATAQGTIFEHMFGGGGRAGFGGVRMRPRPIVRTALRVSFEEAVRGTSKVVDLSSLGIPGIGSKTVEINIPAGGRAPTSSQPGQHHSWFPGLSNPRPAL